VERGFPNLVAIKSNRGEIFSGEYGKVLADISNLLESARHVSARTINSIMTMTYWHVGRRIVEFEQGGTGRAKYGERLIERLSSDLSRKFGRGFSMINLRLMRRFYLEWQNTPIRQTPPFEMETSIQQTLSVESRFTGNLPGATLSDFARKFALPWSHYVRLLSEESPEARTFYEQEALRGGWSLRQLDRQISTKFYERALLSKNKAEMLRNGEISNTILPEEEIKSPFVLEFLGLKDEYSENDLEEALICKLEDFLLELGGDFTFVGRQRRLRIGSEWYRMDLLFFHRRLHCLVVIDLKVGKFTHADAGQMHLYLNYAKENWMRDGENPPVGLILCTEKDEAVAHYSLEGLSSKVLAAEYKMMLPNEKTLAREIEKNRKMLEARQAPKFAKIAVKRKGRKNKGGKRSPSLP
jgi:predicted nuclease of restriction endonuclease-like (RecB) superfamily